VRGKALVLLSGGLDSSVLLWWLKKRGWKLSTLSVFFPGRRRMEIKASKRLAKLANCKENHEITIPFVPPPKAERGCYIPKRNLMYYGIAASLAEAIGAKVIAGGHIKHDGAVFRDAKRSYLMKISKLAGIHFVFPFIGKGKKDIIKVGEKLKVPFYACWSCSKDSKKHCWKCKSCKERILGFLKAGVKDPLCTA